MNNSKNNISVTTLGDITEDLLGNLKERPRLIIERRFGLGEENAMVLGKIGKEFKITRERVRQIESDSFKKLKEAPKSDDYNVVENKAIGAIESAGDFCEKRTLKEKVKKDPSSMERNQLMFILNCSKELKFFRGKLDTKGFWFASDNKKIEVKISKANDFIVKFIKKKETPVTFGEILEAVRSADEWSEFFKEKRGKMRLKMVLKVSRLVDKNILGEWGLKNWKIISQRGAREKAYIVLRKHEEPMHFRKITLLINGYWDKKEALPQTVHNELIKDDRFVLVGRGIYGLCDWGYMEGTVKEIIRLFLEKTNEPVDKEVIISYVLGKKKVKRTTVMVTLADRAKFRKTTDGLFALRR